MNVSERTEPSWAERYEIERLAEQWRHAVESSGKIKTRGHQLLVASGSGLSLFAAARSIAERHESIGSLEGLMLGVVAIAAALAMVLAIGTMRSTDTHRPGALDAEWSDDFLQLDREDAIRKAMVDLVEANKLMAEECLSKATMMNAACVAFGCQSIGTIALLLVAAATGQPN